MIVYAYLLDNFLNYNFFCPSLSYCWQKKDHKKYGKFVWVSLERERLNSRCLVFFCNLIILIIILKYSFSCNSILNMYKLKMYSWSMNSLFESITCLPRLNQLNITYNILKNVTNNFTSDATRVNCSKLEALLLCQL